MEFGFWNLLVKAKNYTEFHRDLRHGEHGEQFLIWSLVIGNWNFIILTLVPFCAYPRRGGLVRGNPGTPVSVWHISLLHR